MYRHNPLSCGLFLALVLGLFWIMQEYIVQYTANHIIRVRAPKVQGCRTKADTKRRVGNVLQRHAQNTEIPATWCAT